MGKHYNKMPASRVTNDEFEERLRRKINEGAAASSTASKPASAYASRPGVVRESSSSKSAGDNFDERMRRKLSGETANSKPASKPASAYASKPGVVHESNSAQASFEDRVRQKTMKNGDSKPPPRNSRVPPMRSSSGLSEQKHRRPSDPRRRATTSDADTLEDRIQAKMRQEQQEQDARRLRREIKSDRPSGLSSSMNSVNSAGEFSSDGRKSRVSRRNLLDEKLQRRRESEKSDAGSEEKLSTVSESGAALEDKIRARREQKERDKKARKGNRHKEKSKSAPSNHLSKSMTVVENEGSNPRISRRKSTEMHRSSLVNRRSSFEKTDNEEYDDFNAELLQLEENVNLAPPGQNSDVNIESFGDLEDAIKLAQLMSLKEH